MKSAPKDERPRALLQETLLRRTLLQKAGLRPTRQRLMLARWLFSGPPKHVTAEQAYAAAKKARTAMSLATVYNTLHAFTGAGLLREVAPDGRQTFFDTNRGEHHHLFDERNGRLFDIPVIAVGALPKLPKGRKLARVDVVVRVR